MRYTVYLQSFFAKFSKSIIDGATQAKDFNIVIKFALCMLFLVAFQMILNITKNSLSERCSARLEMILKKYILDLVIKKIINVLHHITRVICKTVCLMM